ncbi:hypothetical protein J7J84_02045 [bacterium]|nr:hypothetical protein [bacterium]
MGALNVLSRGDLEYAVQMLIGLVWELHKPYADKNGATLTDLLSQAGGETGAALLALVSEMWRAEDYKPDEWAELEGRLGL